MIAWLAGLVLRFASGGVLQRLLAIYETRKNSAVESERIAAELAAKRVDAEIAARANAREIRLATAGFFEMRLLTALIAGCFTLHLVLVTLDTCFALGWAIAKFPPPFDEWEGAILLSFFGVMAAEKGVTAIAAAIGRKRN